MLISGFLIVFFGFFILFGYLGLRSYRRLQKVGLRTSATVIGVEKQVGHDSQGKSISYHPVVEFRIANGEIITGRVNSRRKSVAQKMEKEKAQIPIIYDPSKPEKFSTDSRSQEVIPMILCIIGIIGVTIGIFGLLGIIDMPMGEESWGI